jgi:ParB/RepB/Spo0J family partition protein
MKKASRDDWRDKKNGAKAFKTTYKVPIHLIDVEPGWNIRTFFDGIPELALDISLRGLIEPLLVDLDPEAGRYKIREGERRFQAIMLINAGGGNITEVEVRPTPGENVTDKLFMMLGSGVHKSTYKPIEIASGISRIKAENDGMSNAEIAKGIGMSRQWVDNMLKIAKLPVEEQVKIAEGDVKYTNALKEVVAYDGAENSKVVIDEFVKWDSGDVSPNVGVFGIQSKSADGESDESDPKTMWKSTVIVPEKSNIHDEMNGIIRPGITPQSEGNSETDKLARQMSREERIESEGEKLKDPDLEAIRKNVLRNCATLEALSNGLSDDLQAEHDRVLGYIRVDMQLNIFEAVKGKFKR